MDKIKELEKEFFERHAEYLQDIENQIKSGEISAQRDHIGCWTACREFDWQWFSSKLKEEQETMINDFENCLKADITVVTERTAPTMSKVRYILNLKQYSKFKSKYQTK